MIYCLTGELIYADALSGLAVIECGGVGYQLSVTANTFTKLPQAPSEKPIRLYTHMQVREDGVELFGFYSREELETFRLLISVSKKRFHHAFKRNRVKRLMREAWRRNKAALYAVCERDNISVDVALVYNATVIHSYEEMLGKTQKAVNEIVDRYEKTAPTSC